MKTFAILFVFIILFDFSIQRCYSQLKNSTEMSKILQDIMKSYDKRILPTKDGKPAVVKLQMYIGDMVPVEAIHMHYSMDLYLREFWYDFRLQLPLNETEQFPLNGQFMDFIWTPDIYFPSGKKGKLHDITRPNGLIRIFPNGEIRSSQRVSVTSFCPMNLENFPFDNQLCTFVLEPYSYNNKQCKLEWSLDGGGPIFKPDDLMMFEFTLHDIKYNNDTSDYGIFGMYDRLIVEFHLRRNINYYILQNYFPTALIVVLSWVGFWIDYRSTPARVALGITTVLTITTLANSIRGTLPPVSYSKSIDYYLLACFLFVFAALVEFAVVGITDIKWRKATKAEQKREKRKRKKRGKQAKEENSEDEVKYIGRNGNESGIDDGGPTIETVKLKTVRYPSSHSIGRGNNGQLDNEAFQHENDDVTTVRSREGSFRKQNGVSSRPMSTDRETECSLESGIIPEPNSNPEPPIKFQALVRAKQFAMSLAKKHRKGYDIHLIDRLCRVLFPLLFFTFNAIYFAVFLTIETKPYSG